MCKMQKDILEFGSISNRFLYSQLNVYFSLLNDDDMIKSKPFILPFIVKNLRF